MAKKSRRARKQEVGKLPQNQTNPAAGITLEAAPENAVNFNQTAPAETAPASIPRKAVDFGLEYYYVYTELRNIAVVAVVLLVVMVGLGFVI